MQRFTLLEVIVDKQMIDENRFLSSELKCRRSLIEILRRLNSVHPTNRFHMYIFNLLDSEYDISDVQY